MHIPRYDKTCYSLWDRWRALDMCAYSLVGSSASPGGKVSSNMFFILSSQISLQILPPPQAQPTIEAALMRQSSKNCFCFPYPLSDFWNMKLQSIEVNGRIQASYNQSFPKSQRCHRSRLLLDSIWFAEWQSVISELYNPSKWMWRIFKETSKHRDIMRETKTTSTNDIWHYSFLESTKDNGYNGSDLGERESMLWMR